MNFEETGIMELYKTHRDLEKRGYRDWMRALEKLVK
jgi:hypothetical protein